MKFDYKKPEEINSDCAEICAENTNETKSKNLKTDIGYAQNKLNKPHKPAENEVYTVCGVYSEGEESENDSLFRVPDEQPPFPTECFSLDIQSIIKEASRVAQVPESLAGGIALGCLSSSLRASLKGEMVSEMFTNPNLFILGIAKSSTGKGRAYSILEKPLHQAEREEREVYYATIKPQIEHDYKEAKEAFKGAQDGGDKAEIKKLSYEVSRLQKQLSEQPATFCEDITKEALAELLSNQPDEFLASHSSEARGLVDNILGQYSQGGSTDESIYCKIYSGDPIKVNRKTGDKKAINVDNPSFSICWALQPDSAEKLSSNPSMIESGLIPRFLVYNSHAELADEPRELLRIEHDVKERWRHILLTLLSFRDRPAGANRIISPSPEAFEVFADFADLAKQAGRSSGILHDLPQFPGRYGENCRKIALILHASEHLENCFNLSISKETAQKAVNLMQWYVWEQLAFLGDIRFKRSYKRVTKLKEFLFRRDEQQDTAGQIKKAIGYELQEIMHLAKEFPHEIQVREKETSTKGGRKSFIVSIPRQNQNNQ